MAADEPSRSLQEEARYWLRECGRAWRRAGEYPRPGYRRRPPPPPTDAEFDATAEDLSEAMLSHSRRLNPGVNHHVGDMRTVRLGETFDAVLIHDAISYMTTEADLLAVFATARAHLRPGGLLITAPDDYTDTFAPPRVDYQTNRNANDTTIETTYVFFIKRGGELRVEVDNHTTGLFPMATWARLLKEVGFEVHRVDYPVSKDGQPMYLWVGRVAGPVPIHRQKSFKVAH